MMKVRTLDHVNIRTEDLPATVAFYTGVLGMIVKPPPGAPDNYRGAWIYDGDDRPVIHVGTSASRYPTDGVMGSQEAGRGSGAIHHVALECDGYDELLAKLKSLDLTVSTNEVTQISLRQIFVEDPNGVTLELNFRNAA
jgi:catechol 2,3-dioxygenase-like lactoylglutathione lyase family enzyme